MQPCCLIFIAISKPLISDNRDHIAFHSDVCMYVCVCVCVCVCYLIVGKGASKLLGGKRKAQLLEAQSPRDQAKKIRASIGRSTRNKARAVRDIGLLTHAYILCIHTLYTYTMLVSHPHHVHHTGTAYIHTYVHAT